MPETRTEPVAPTLQSKSLTQRAALFLTLAEIDGTSSPRAIDPRGIDQPGRFVPIAPPRQPREDSELPAQPLKANLTLRSIAAPDQP